MNEYSPSKIRVLLECWSDYLYWGKMPPLRHDSHGWHVCDPDEHIRQKPHKESDGLEAIRVRADLKMAIRPRLGNEPREPLTRGERTYIITRFFAGFQEWEATDMSGVNNPQRTFYDASVKMAHNLGYHMS